VPTCSSRPSSPSAFAKGRINTSTAHVADVGASYGLAAMAGLLVARVRRRWLTLYTTAISGLLATCRDTPTLAQNAMTR
jgi:hypothetical protein